MRDKILGVVNNERFADKFFGKKRRAALVEMLLEQLDASEEASAVSEKVRDTETVEVNKKRPAGRPVVSVPIGAKGLGVLNGQQVNSDTAPLTVDQ